MPAAKTRRPSRRSPFLGAGLGVDIQGNPAFDPSYNVDALVERVDQRQDDFRESNNKFLEAKIKCLEDSIEQLKEHSKEIRKLETSRVNAVRQVDVLAGQTTAAEARQAIQTLAATTSATAEGLRNTVATTAQALATTNSAQFGELS